MALLAGVVGRGYGRILKPARRPQSLGGNLARGPAKPEGMGASHLVPGERMISRQPLACLPFLDSNQGYSAHGRFARCCRPARLVLRPRD